MRLPRALPITLVLALAWAGPGRAQQASEAALIAKSPLPASAVGFVVLDMDTGQIVAAKDANTPFIPASVAKVATTVAALEILGSDYRFQTRIYVKPQPGAHNGTVAELYLVGGGDPVLDGDDMLKMIKAVEATGVSHVAGKFFYDESYLSSVKRIAAIKPDYAAHNTGVGALSVNFNRFRVNWVRAGKQAVLHANAFSLTNHLKIEIGTIGFALGQPSAKSKGPFVYAELGGRDHWIVSPYLRRKGYAWLPVRRVGLTAAAVFRGIGETHGLSLPRPHAGKAPADARLVYDFRSQPLTTVVRRLLYFSNNLAAELTGLVATRTLDGKPLTLSQSGAAIAAWLKTRLPSVDWTGFVLANHSGLSLESRISPRQVLELLRYAHARHYGALSYAGLLKHYYLPQRLVSKPGYSVRAKSGTMDYIRGRAGYIRTLGGRHLVFALFIGQPYARDDYEGPREGLPAVHAGPRRWRYQARVLEQALIARWVSVY